MARGYDWLDASHRPPTISGATSQIRCYEYTRCRRPLLATAVRKLRTMFTLPLPVGGTRTVLIVRRPAARLRPRIRDDRISALWCPAHRHTLASGGPPSPAPSCQVEPRVTASDAPFYISNLTLAHCGGLQVVCGWTAAGPGLLLADALHVALASRYADRQRSPATGPA